MAETDAPTRPRHIGQLLDSELMAQLDALDVLSRKVLQGKLQGERLSKRRGHGAEFTDHRPYAVGDDLRFIDWHIFSRLEQLFIKVFLEEQDLTVHLMLDISASMATGEPSKDLAARRLCAALAYVGLVNNSRVTVSLFADGVVRQMANLRGRLYVPRLAELLLTTDAGGAGDLDKVARAAVANRVGSGICVLISDMLHKGGYDEALRRLIGARYELYVLQVLSPQELTPDLAGDLKLTDVEDGDTAEITASRTLLDYYEKAVRAYCNELRDFCTARGATYMLTPSATPTQRLMLDYLRRKGLVG